MKNRVFVYDESQNLISKYVEKMEKFLISRGLFDFSFRTTTDFEEFQEDLSGRRQNGSTIVVVCDNDKLDKCLETVKIDGDELSLVDEQAVRLENLARGEKMIFVPFELDFEKFLEGFLPEEQIQIFSVFGKSRKFVMEQFDNFESEFEGSYTIITKHSFLHIVYCSAKIAKDNVFQAFGDGVYSQKDETLAESLLSLLADAGKSLTTVEYGTRGRLAYLLNCDGEVVRNQDGLEKIGVTQETLVGENAGKEVVFALSKRGLEKEGANLVLSVCDRLGFGERSYISVGDREVIHLYSSIFSDDKDEREKVLCDFAIFRMICFLKKQNN